MMEDDDLGREMPRLHRVAMLTPGQKPTSSIKPTSVKLSKVSKAKQDTSAGSAVGSSSTDERRVAELERHLAAVS